MEKMPIVEEPNVVIKLMIHFCRYHRGLFSTNKTLLVSPLAIPLLKKSKPRAVHRSSINHEEASPHECVGDIKFPY
ncbi:hypothetical protein BDV27DRAFT_149653 [Aspergillus caelatus]|uniref:Uncharacterized protein n=1 Tax=Aspergillus caelatus TaxID=61420 RepID=A0A5N6ZPS2_9EURO|nr:uncharacterized protein BDV27DRAFT_149653 [Aspergillus caelatus]KAE8359368.1 hypothetical protein BDV27DRAFT_149653 [Aspergillus caelatus]